MIDRLQDYIKLVKDKGISLNPPTDTLLNQESQLMQDFTHQIQQGNLIISNIRTNTESLTEKKTHLTNAVGDKETRLKVDIEGILENTTDQRKKGKTVVENIAKLKTDHKNDCEKNKDLENPELRVIENLYGAYLKNFEEAVNKNQSIQSDIRNIIQKKIIRSAEIILQKDLNPEQKAEILQNNQLVEQMMENKLTQGQAHIQLQNSLKDLQERHKDIQMLENSVNQVHKLFLDLALLVQQQGEMVDNIELNIKQAKDYTLKAEVLLVDTKKNLQAARKKKCCILLIVVGIMVVILIPILATQLTGA